MYYVESSRMYDLFFSTDIYDRFIKKGQMVNIYNWNIAMLFLSDKITDQNENW